MFVRWDITESCNLNCIHCIVGGGKNNKDDLRLSQVFNIINILKSNNVESIHFLGGEPFARKGFYDILDYCKYKNIIIGITTNGTLINEAQFSNFIKDYKLPIAITFSFDGPTEYTNDKIRGKGTYNQCLQSLRIISSFKKHYSNLSVAINGTINKQSKTEITKYFDLAKSENIDILSLTELVYQGNAIENKQNLDIKRSDLVEVINELFEFYAKYDNSKLRLMLPFPPKVTEFLNRKYKSNIPYSKGNCVNLQEGIYINNKGYIYPCDLPEIIDNLIEENLISSNGLYLDTTEKLFSNTDFNSCKNYIFNKLEDKNNKMSHIQCEYKTLCIGCPVKPVDNSLCELCEIICK